MYGVVLKDDSCIVLQLKKEPVGFYIVNNLLIEVKNEKNRPITKRDQTY